MTARHEIAREMAEQEIGHWIEEWITASDLLNVMLMRASLEDLKRRVANLIAAVMPEEHKEIQP